MKELSNCSMCGALFVKITQSICMKCQKAEEDWLIKVTSFLRKKENRLALREDILAETSIPPHVLQSLIRSGRLQLKLYPNLTHSCERCQKPTQEKRMCRDCMAGLHQELRSIETKAENEPKTNVKQNQFSLRNTLENSD